MRYLFTVLIAVVVVFASGPAAEAQLPNENPTGSPNVSGQTGQSDRFAIQRDPTGFIGGSTTNIVGAQAATGQTGFGALGTAGLIGGLGNFGRGNLGFGNQATQATQQSAAQPQIRFRITLGFSHPRPAGAKVSASFARRLSRIPQLPSARSVAVTMEERTAVLAGEVDSERAKRLIEKLAMMEPGVSAVRNELTVTPAQELPSLLEATN